MLSACFTRRGCYFFVILLNPWTCASDTHRMALRYLIAESCTLADGWILTELSFIALPVLDFVRTDMQNSEYPPFSEVVFIYLYSHHQWDMSEWRGGGHSTIWGSYSQQHNTPSAPTAAMQLELNSAMPSGTLIHHTAVSELFHTAELNCTNTNYTYSKHHATVALSPFSLSLTFKTLGRFDSHGSP